MRIAAAIVAESIERSQRKNLKMALKRIVETDNFGGDYPNEKFLPIPPVDEASARVIAYEINKATGENGPRFWKVVDVDYVLQSGFEP